MSTYNFRCLRSFTPLADLWHLEGWPLREFEK